MKLMNLKIYILIIILLISIISFSQNDDFVENIVVPDTSDIFYKTFRKLQTNLNLEDLRYGSDSIKIRFWINTLSSLNNIYELSYSDTSWLATKITYGYVIKTTRIFKIKIKSKSEDVFWVNNLIPKNSWDTIINSLLQNNILNIRHQAELDSANNWNINDGVTYKVEYSTKTKYRYYDWTNPKHGLKKYWDTFAIMNVAEIFRNDFEIDNRKK
jgi:hypothetical protein